MTGYKKLPGSIKTPDRGWSVSVCIVRDEAEAGSYLIFTVTEITGKRNSVVGNLYPCSPKPLQERIVLAVIWRIFQGSIFFI